MVSTLHLRRLLIQSHSLLLSLPFLVACALQTLHIFSRSRILPRHFSFLLDWTKNNMRGVGPDSGRSFMLPCSCMRIMSKSQCVTSARNLSSNPDRPCISACVFQVSILYAISDNYFFKFILIFSYYFANVGQLFEYYYWPIRISICCTRSI